MVTIYNFWKFRGLSDESVNSVTASSYSIAPSLDYPGAKKK